MSVDASIDGLTDLFGKTVSDLQSGVTIGDGAITGTLHYVEDYAGFSSRPEEQSGHYIVLHAEVPEASEAVITVKVTNPVTLDEDGIAVLRIEDKSSQTITVVASMSGYEPVTKVFTLDGLTLQGE